jgi:predicted transcriptional regulator
LKKERTSVLLNQEDMLKLKAMSKRTNKSASFLIQEAVSEFIAKASPVKNIGIIGMVDSGDPNFAQKDEEILDKITSEED